MTGHRSWNADRAARLTDPEIARLAAEARAELARWEQAHQETATDRPAEDQESWQLPSFVGTLESGDGEIAAHSREILRD